MLSNIVSIALTFVILSIIITITYIFLNKLNGGSGSRTYASSGSEAESNIQQNENLRASNVIHQQQQRAANVIDPNKKLTKKEQIKMLKKQEKAEQREYQRQMLEAKKLKEQQKEREMIEKEKKKEEERKKLEEELQKVKEEQEKKENEMYNQWKDMIKVGEEGEEGIDFTDENVQNNFLNYIKIRKVVSLEDIAAVFKIQPNEVVSYLNHFEEEGKIIGIVDDRGKYIYITEKEMNLIEKMLGNRGRISRSDLIKECNRIIRFEPTEEDKAKIAQEQEEILNKIENKMEQK